MAKIKKNRLKKTVKQHIFFITKLLIFVFFIASIAWLSMQIDFDKFLKVDISWDIDKSLPIEQEILANKIKPLIKNKYQINLNQIKKILENEPWVKKASVKRLLWNHIKIKIFAQKIAVRWKDVNCSVKNKNNCNGYISPIGELFIPSKKLKSDTALLITNKDKEAVVKIYKDYQNYQDIIKPMIIKTVSRTGIDKLTIGSNIKVILGSKEQKQRLVNFKKIYQKLIKKNKKNKNVTFDMRYPKGFSLSYQ